MNLRFAFWIALALAPVLATPATANYCAADTVPAATLLLPYFEVDLDDPAGQTTLFSVNNALDTAGLAKVTLWSDWGVPTLTFDVYLTGYDVQTFNLRDVFNGVLPRTASDGQDPTDAISPQGVLSQDINIASCATTLPLPSVLPTVLIQYLRDVHTGRTSSTIAPGKCYSHRYPDGHARGYVTVDAVRACDVNFPSEPGYFDTTATRENRFWGTVTYIDPANNSAQQESLVHIEACHDAEGGAVPGSELCPGGDETPYTFYGRLVGFDGSDGREPLASVFSTSYLNGGAFSGGTELIVWRDTKVPVEQSFANADCTAPALPTWAPLGQREVLAFDEQENPETFCLPPNILPPSPFSGYCFPFATQKTPVGLGDGSFPGDTITPTSPFGWLHLDLNRLEGAPQGERAQAWVMTVSSAGGRYSTAVDAIRLDSACDATLRPTLE
jgi:hypothetical protein